MKKRTIFWLTTIFLFLFLISCSNGQFALTIFGNKDAIGADVYIDGRYSGKMKSSGGDSSRFGKWLPHGAHVIEVKKGGYKTYKEIIDIKEGESEYYMDAKLRVAE